ncbi:PAS domain S-box protein, partial [bacterium]|nr:PAS domain S-box protein [bacterium]
TYNIMFANKYLYELLKISEDKKITIPYLISLAPDKTKKLLNERMMARFADKKVVNTYEIEAKTTDGQELNLILSTQMIKYDGKDAAMVNLTDITEYKKMEKQIKFLNNLLKAIGKVNQYIVRENNIKNILEKSCEALTDFANYILVWVIIYDDDGKKVYCPKNYSDKKELIKLSQLDDTPFQTAYRQKTHSSGKIEENANLDNHIIKKLKENRIKYWTSFPIIYQDDIYGVLNIFSDDEIPKDEAELRLLKEVSEDIAFALYTSRLREIKETAVKKLAESERMYRLLFDNAPIGIIIHDGENFIIANPQAAKSLGYESPQQLIGKPVMDIIAPESAVSARARINKLLTEKKSLPSIEETLVRKDGEKIIAEMISKPIEFMGKTAVLVLATDVTEKIKSENERKALEEKLMQVQKLEAIGRLAGGIAHEFNNLLNGIIGYAELLRENISVSDPNFRYAEQILKTGLDAAKLTRQILSFSRKDTIDIEPFSANDAVLEIVEILSKTVPRKIEIITELADDEPIAIGDLTRMEQVLMNLCVNSCDAMPNGGKLVISTENISIDSKNMADYKGVSPGNYVLFTVKDNGRGMDEETIEHIFDPFFTTKEPGKGTGLGLSIVYNVVSEHNGHITVESKPGAGTTIRVFIPSAEEKAIIKKTVFESGELHKGNETILIVDDEDIVRNLLVDLLQSRGYRVISAVDGREAIELFRRRKYEIDLIILDVVMPQVDGYEALRRIMEIDPDAKVLMASGYAHADIVQKCMDVGAKGFIRKPFRIAEISEKIYRAISEKK